MNQNSTTKSPLLLSLSNLCKPCDELYNLVNNKDSSRKEKIEYEQNLWKRIKDTRELNDDSLLVHFIGYYSRLLIHVCSKYPKCDILEYNILIRLGDLNRYTNQAKIAEIYYCNARNQFPAYGHAYNQLALLTSSTDLYKCSYYYARAAKSCLRPLATIADSNLRIAVAKFECAFLSHILDNDTPIELNNRNSLKNGQCMKVPNTAIHWFYVIVVAIYSDNIQSIAKIFIDYMSDNFSTHKWTTTTNLNKKITTIFCDKDNYLLLACLDVMLDWMKIGSQSKQLIPSICTDLRRVRSCLHSSLTSIRIESNHIKKDNSTICASPSLYQKRKDTTPSSVKTANDTSSTVQNSSSTTNIDSSNSSRDPITNLQDLMAFPHDHILRGFSPLNDVHESLVFKQNLTRVIDIEWNGTGSTNQKFIHSNQLIILLSRIKLKLDSLSPLLKRQTRNIALESILSNMTNADTELADTSNKQTQQNRPLSIFD